MPKMKSNSGAKKRFSLTGTGRVKRATAGKRHNTGRKASKRMRQLRGTTLVDTTQEHQVKAMLPYGTK